MKTLVTIAVHLILGLLIASAQTATTTTTSSSSSTKVTICDDNSKVTTEKYYRSYSIINKEDSFKVKAKFMESLTEDVRSYLIEQFGKENTNGDAGIHIWTKKIDDENVYEVYLKKNLLRINLDKELASNTLLKRFEHIGQKLKTITSKKNHNQ